LLVLLNHPLGTFGCLIRVLASRPSRPSLSKEIPALIEFEFDLPKALMLLGGRRHTNVTLF
jgi:hypothetical protein